MGAFFNTRALTSLLQSRTFPEQAYRSYLGVLSLARKYPNHLLETACQRSQEACLLSYPDLKDELESLARQSKSGQPFAVH